jgi:four helix bundle protein
MERGSTFRELVAWQVGIELAEMVYRWTLTLPKEEKYGLVSQLQRAATSVPLNIAEGWGLGTTPQYLRHCRQSRGSLCELETALEIATRVHAAHVPQELHDTRDRCSRLIQGLISSLERKLREEASS